MHPMLNTAVKAARAAGGIILRNIDRIDTLTIGIKSRNDYVSEVDRMAEEKIIHVLGKAYPEHGFFGEESGGRADGAEYQWVIDPLDGTTNFLHGVPQYAVSIALRRGGHFEQAVIYDPLKDELFTASRGGGAQLNGRRIRVSKTRSLEGALLGTGIPFRDDQDLDLYLETLRVLVPGTAGVRRAGSAALDLAYVATGRFDGFWEFGLHKWDIAAGILLVQEAGGLVGDPYGGLDHYENGDILCGSAGVYKGMLERLRNVSALRAHAS